MPMGAPAMARHATLAPAAGGARESTEGRPLAAAVGRVVGAMLWWGMELLQAVAQLAAAGVHVAFAALNFVRAVLMPVLR